MKQNIFLLVSIPIIMMVFSGFTGHIGSESGVNPKIQLTDRSGGTRSGTATEVEAFLVNGNILTVEIGNYNGMAWVSVTGTGGTIQESLRINESGLMEIDLSTLTRGVYLLNVTLENRSYEGYFEY